MRPALKGLQTTQLSFLGHNKALLKETEVDRYLIVRKGHALVATTFVTRFGRALMMTPLGIQARQSSLQPLRELKFARKIIFLEFEFL